MSTSRYAGRARFGLLPEPESNPASILTSCILNIGLLALLLVVGSFAHKQIEQRKLENMAIVFPTTPPPEIKPKVKIPPPPKMPDPPKPAIVKLEMPKINIPKPEPKPEIKQLPIVKEPVNLPKIAAKPQVVTLAPQVKAVTLAAAPALTPQQKVSTAPVHFGDLNGVKPNPNASKPATVAAIGNPYGGNKGPAEAPRGIVGSTGFGNGTKSGSSAGTMGKVASAGIPGGTGLSSSGSAGSGKVASAVLPAMATQSTQQASVAKAEDTTTPPVVVSYSKAEYTSEALQLRIQGEVVLRVKVTTNGQAVVLGVLHGLGHGLDEAAVRSAPTYRFKPATRNGQPVEFTTNIIVRFQTA